MMQVIFSKITLEISPFLTRVQGRRKIDNWGGGGAIFIYSRSQTVKTIDFKI